MRSAATRLMGPALQRTNTAAAATGEADTPWLYPLPRVP